MQRVKPNKQSKNKHNLLDMTVAGVADAVVGKSYFMTHHPHIYKPTPKC